MKKDAKFLAIVASVVLLVLLICYNIQRYMVARSQVSQQVPLQRLKEQTESQSAKAKLSAQEANALTEEYIQSKMALEANRLNKIGLKGEQKQRLLNSESVRLHDESVKIVTTTMTPTPR